MEIFDVVRQKSVWSNESEIQCNPAVTVMMCAVWNGLKFCLFWNEILEVKCFCFSVLFISSLFMVISSFIGCLYLAYVYLLKFNTVTWDP